MEVYSTKSKTYKKVTLHLKKNFGNTVTNPFLPDPQGKKFPWRF
jgi:hypothetical protein